MLKVKHKLLSKSGPLRVKSAMKNAKNVLLFLNILLVSICLYAFVLNIEPVKHHSLIFQAIFLRCSAGKLS